MSNFQNVHRRNKRYAFFFSHQLSTCYVYICTQLYATNFQGFFFCKTRLDCIFLTHLQTLTGVSKILIKVKLLVVVLSSTIEHISNILIEILACMPNILACRKGRCYLSMSFRNYA